MLQQVKFLKIFPKYARENYSIYKIHKSGYLIQSSTSFSRFKGDLKFFSNWDAEDLRQPHVPRLVCIVFSAYLYINLEEF